jgi:hypothetical protein
MCSLTSQQKARWFREAFAIPRLSWAYILKEWHSHLPKHGHVDVIDGIDQDSDSVEGLDEHVAVIPDPSSELIQSVEQWHTLWSWLPEWVFCKEPQCVFRASRDGYK